MQYIDSATGGAVFPRADDLQFCLGLELDASPPHCHVPIDGSGDNRDFSRLETVLKCQIGSP